MRSMSAELGFSAKALTRSLACFLYCSRLGRAGNSLSGIRSSFRCFAWSPHESGWKEGSSNRLTGGGHGPFRGLDGPSRSFYSRKVPKRMSSGLSRSENDYILNFVWRTPLRRADRSYFAARTPLIDFVKLTH